MTGTVALAVDATGFAVRRPCDPDREPAMFSYKHRSHEVKATLAACAETAYIHYIGRLAKGSEHDFSMFKREFGKAAGFFTGLTVLMDAGYTGASALLRETGVDVTLGIARKRPRGGQLQDWEVAHNRAIASVRVRGEHAIRGTKRYRVLSARSSFKCLRFFDMLVGVLAGLWNFRILHRMGRLAPLTG